MINRYKICYIDESPTIGGAEKYLHMLTNHFNRDYEITIVHANNLTHKEYYHNAQISQIALSKGTLSGFRKILKYYEIFKRIAPDILHVNQPAPDRCHHSIIAGRLASIKRIVSTCHLPSVVFKRSLLGMVAGKSIYDQIIYKIVFNILDKIIVVSESGIDDLLNSYNVSGNKGICVHNGVDYERFCSVSDSASKCVRNSLNIPNDHLLLSTVGRLHSQKGFSALLKAFGEVYRRHSKVNLLIVGEGELRQELGKLAAELGIEKVTHLVGQRADIPEILAASDIYINSSLYEGLPFSILEAMASGLPVIASAVDGNNEVLKNGNGILVPPGNHEKMVNEIIFLVDNEEYRKKLGNTGREYVRNHYSINSMMTTTEKIYLNVSAFEA